MEQSRNRQELEQQFQALLEEQWHIDPQEPFSEPIRLEQSLSDSEMDGRLDAPQASAPQEPVEQANRRRRRRKRSLSWQKELRLMLRQGIIILAALSILLTFFFRIARVEGESMLPTLADREWLLLQSSAFYTPRRGDIIIFMAADYGEIPLIKRVIATEGDTVDIDFDRGTVYVNGQALSEPYLFSQTRRDFGEKGVEFPQQIQPGHVFVLGDNRNNSDDSRCQSIGQVDCRNILGKALAVVWPGSGASGVQWGRLGFVE